MCVLTWLSQNRDLIQTATSLLIALLTILLIRLNSQYVKANQRIVKLMESDLKQRTTPFPVISLISNYGDATGIYSCEYFVSCTNAPMLVEDVRLLYMFADGEEMAGSETPSVLRPIAIDERVRFAIKMKLADKGVTAYSLYLTYYDMSRTYKYETVWTPSSLRTREIT